VRRESHALILGILTAAATFGCGGLTDLQAGSTDSGGEPRDAGPRETEAHDAPVTTDSGVCAPGLVTLAAGHFGLDGVTPAIAIDATSVYWASSNNGFPMHLKKVPLCGFGATSPSAEAEKNTRGSKGLPVTLFTSRPSFESPREAPFRQSARASSRESAPPYHARTAAPDSTHRARARICTRVVEDGGNCKADPEAKRNPSRIGKKDAELPRVDECWRAVRLGAYSRHGALSCFPR